MIHFTHIPHTLILSCTRLHKSIHLFSSVFLEVDCFFFFILPSTSVPASDSSSDEPEADRVTFTTSAVAMGSYNGRPSCCRSNFQIMRTSFDPDDLCLGGLGGWLCVMAVVERCRDCSIVLLCGIPSSGKTTFAHRLSEEVIRRVGGGEGFTDTAWGVITVHFDDYHPPDLREERAGGKHNSLGYGSDEEGSSISFVLKQSRQDISDCIKHFILMNDLGRASEVLPSCTTSGRVPKLWDQFVGHVKIKRCLTNNNDSRFKN